MYMCVCINIYLYICEKSFVNNSSVLKISGDTRQIPFGIHQYIHICDEYLRKTATRKLNCIILIQTERYL